VAVGQGRPGAVNRGKRRQRTMSTSGAKLTRKQEQAISALLTKGSIRKAAVAAGVSDRTLRTWLRNLTFAAAYRTARRQVVEQTVARVQRASGRAVLTLTRLLKCGHAPTEKGAAVALLDYSLRGVEVADLAQAVEDLKAEMEAMRNGARGTAATGAEDAGGGGAAVGAADAAAGPAACGPGAPPAGGGDGAGPVAADPAAFAFTADVAPLQPPGGQEPNVRGAGAP
jgi:hypothetical protein